MKTNRIVFLTLCLVYFGLFFMANKVLPLMADDYGYRVAALNGSNVFLDALRVAKEYYFVWGGRSIAHFFAHIIMWSYSNQFGFLVYAILNTLVLVSIIYHSYLIIQPSPDINKNPLYVLDWKSLTPLSMSIFSLLVLLLTINPKSHYQTLYWATGVAHYSWMYAIFIFALARFKYYFLLEKELKLSLLNLIILFAIGLSYENVGLSLCALVGLRILRDLWLQRKVKGSFKIPFQKIFPLFVLFSGSVIMLLAPGNKLREKVAFPEGTGTILNKIQWWFESWLIFLGRPEGFLVLLVCSLILYKLKKYRKNSLKEIIKENKLVRNLGLLCILMAACYLGHSGNFYGRKGFNVGWIFCLFLLSLIIHAGFIDAIQSLRVRTVSSIIMACLLLSSARWAYDFYIINEYSIKFNYREQSILNAKESGTMDIKTYSIKNPFDLEDLSDQTDSWINVPYSKLLGVNSISATQENK